MDNNQSSQSSQFSQFSQYKQPNNQMHKLTTLALLALAATTATAQKDTLEVKQVTITGPHVLPHVMTTTEKDANDKAFDQNDLQWDMPTNLDQWKEAADKRTIQTTDSTGLVIDKNGLYQLAFTIDNNRYTKVTIAIKAKSKNALYIDGRQQSGEVALTAGRHECVLKLQHKGEVADTIDIKVIAPTDTLWTAHFTGIRINAEGRRYYTLADNMIGEKLHSLSMSANGRFVLENAYVTRNDGKTEWTKYIIDLQTGNRYQPQNFVQWAAKGGEYISKRLDSRQRAIYEYTDVLTGKTRHLYTAPTNEGLHFAAQGTKAIV